MRITVNDSRTLAVALAQPGNDKLWNWTTSAWESGPFNAASHARALAPVEAAPSPLAAVQTADIGYELANRPDAAAVLFAVSGSGATASYTAVDTWSIPVAPWPLTGGFTRM